MKIAYATYVDHQAEIQYPIGFLKSKIPHLLVYASDDENRRVLLTQATEAKVIGIKINSPGDIATAQNACISDLFANTDADYVIWNQADIFITDRGHQIIKDFCVPENLENTQALGLLHIKLFHYAGFTYYGVNIIGKKAWERIKFTGDGAYLGSGGADYCSKEHSSVDIGYLSIDQVRRHLSKHKQTWVSNDNVHELPTREFVTEFLRRHNDGGLIEQGSEHFKLIEDLGLTGEYFKIKEMIYG